MGYFLMAQSKPVEEGPFEPARKSCMDSGGAEVLWPLSCGHGQVAAMEDACGRARQPFSLLCWGPWDHPAL